MVFGIDSFVCFYIKIKVFFVVNRVYLRAYLSFTLTQASSTTSVDFIHLIMTAHIFGL